MHHIHVVPLMLDALSLSVIAAWWAGVVPSIATTLTALWVGFQITREIYRYFKEKDENENDK